MSVDVFFVHNLILDHSLESLVISVNMQFVHCAVYIDIFEENDKIYILDLMHGLCCPTLS